MLCFNIQWASVYKVCKQNIYIYTLQIKQYFIYYKKTLKKNNY